jgi:hypothetical protein
LDGTTGSLEIRKIRKKKVIIPEFSSVVGA